MVSPPHSKDGRLRKLTKVGGVLGIPCSHAYPHAAAHAKELLPSGLKAADLAVYSALRALGVETKVLPVIKESVGDSDFDKSMIANFLKYLKDGKEFAVQYRQYPTQIPVDLDVDRYWKTLYLARHAIGLEGFLDVTQKLDWKLASKEFWMNRGAFLGVDLKPYTTTDYSGEDIPLTVVSNHADITLRRRFADWIY